jgi:chromosome segregation ATPase
MNNGINDPNNNNMHNPLDLSYLMHVNDIDQLKSDLVKAHDFISILQKENDYLKKQRDGALNQLAANENMKNIDRVKCDEIQNENKELRKRLNDEIKNNKIKDNYISDLKADLNNLQNIIKDKDRQIQNLLLDMRKLEQDANNEINKLKNIIDDLNREKEAIIRDFQKQINDLNDELRHLNNLLEDEKRKVKELENKIKTMKRFDEKRQKLLENLFNWYNNMNKLLNTNTATGKAPPKELLNDVINLQTPDEFKDKLNQIEEKLKQFIDDMKLKFGECFACDIACCTSEVDRLKYFRKYYPGPPKDYLEGKKKCKCV